MCLETACATHADLFWVLRGSGGNYGIVTSFEYQLHPVGPTVLAGIAFYPYEWAALSVWVDAEEWERHICDSSTRWIACQVPIQPVAVISMT
jgi:FAD/FMN-containing dehydrogenase